MPVRYDAINIQLFSDLGRPAWRVDLPQGEIDTAIAALCKDRGYSDPYPLIQHLGRLVSAEVKRLAAE